MATINLGEMPTPGKLARQAEWNHEALIRLTIGPARQLLPLWSEDYPEDTHTPAAVEAAGKYITVCDLANPDPALTREVSSELAAAYQRLYRHAYIALTAPDA